MHVFDDAGRLLTEKWYDISSTLVDTRSFTYDDNGAILTAGDSDGTYTFGYDSRGLVTTAAEPFGVSLTMAYDDAGRRTLVSDSFGGYETSVYDDAGRLSSRRYVNGSTNMAVSMGYDAAGRITSLLRKSGVSTVATTSTTYDGAGRVSSIVSKDASSATISSYSYTYDSVGQLSSKTENGATTSFGYDGGGQVTLDGSSTYTYDGSGNRTNAGYVTSDDNRLDSDGVWNYTYDDEGNLTEKVSSSLGYHWVYEYDHRNQMTSAKQYGATLSGPEPLLLSADYKYDVFGNRIEKSVDADGAGSGAAVAERYAIDWFNPKKVATVGNENADIWASFTSGGSLTSRHLHGDVVDQVFARMDGSGNPAWLLTDRLGSVRDVIDDSATIIDRVSFDAFGNILSETNASGRGLYAFTGRQFDDETGFQNNRARYYDPTTARWTTKDPIGFDAGDSNLYRYVNNKATGATDPSGLDYVSYSYNGLDYDVYWMIEKPGSLWTLGFAPNVRAVNIGTIRTYKTVSGILDAPPDQTLDIVRMLPAYGGGNRRLEDLEAAAAQYWEGRTASGPSNGMKGIWLDQMDAPAQEELIGELLKGRFDFLAKEAKIAAKRKELSQEPGIFPGYSDTATGQRFDRLHKYRWADSQARGIAFVPPSHEDVEFFDYANNFLGKGGSFENWLMAASPAIISYHAKVHAKDYRQAFRQSSRHANAVIQWNAAAGSMENGSHAADHATRDDDEGTQCARPTSPQGTDAARRGTAGYRLLEFDPSDGATRSNACAESSG